MLVTDRADGSVSTYAIVDATGRLVFIGKAAAGTNPAAVSVAPSGKAAYVANAGDGTVSQYTVGADGTLTPMAPPTVTAGTGVRRLALDPAGHFAYAVNPGSGDVTAYSVAANGALTRVGATPVGMSPQAIAIDPGGQFVYVANSGGNNVSQLKVGADGSLAAMTPSTVAAGAAPGAITVDRTGRFAYVANVDRRHCLAIRDRRDRRALPPVAGDLRRRRVSNGDPHRPTGHFAYVTRGGTSGTIAQLAIGPRGTLSSLTPATATVEADPQAITVDGNGGLVYVAGGTSNSVTAFDVIPTSGALSALPRVPGQGSPSSVAIVAGDDAGAGGRQVRLRRQRRRRHAVAVHDRRQRRADRDEPAQRRWDRPARRSPSIRRIATSTSPTTPTTACRSTRSAPTASWPRSLPIASTPECSRWRSPFTRRGASHTRSTRTAAASPSTRRPPTER